MLCMITYIAVCFSTRCEHIDLCHFDNVHTPYPNIWTNCEMWIYVLLVVPCNKESNTKLHLATLHHMFTFLAFPTFWIYPLVLQYIYTVLAKLPLNDNTLNSLAWMDEATDYSIATFIVIRFISNNGFCLMGPPVKRVSRVIGPHFQKQN